MRCARESFPKLGTVHSNTNFFWEPAQDGTRKLGFECTVPNLSDRLYSYLSASVEFNCDALLAGNIPNITPTATETPKATTTDIGEIGTRMSSVRNRTLNGIASPSRMPIATPVRLMTTDS